MESQIGFSPTEEMNHGQLRNHDCVFIFSGHFFHASRHHAAFPASSYFNIVAMGLGQSLSIMSNMISNTWESDIILGLVSILATLVHAKSMRLSWTVYSYNMFSNLYSLTVHVFLCAFVVPGQRLLGDILY